MDRQRGGVLLCLLSAAAFSTSTIFGRVALEAGAGVLTLLALRYAGAALLFWAVVRLAGQPLPAWPGLASILGLGASLVALQALLFYSALARLDAGLVTLLLYTFPSIVAIAAVAIGRERPDRWKTVAVLAATAGVALVLQGGAALRTDSFGIALGLAAAICAAGWVLVSDRVLRDSPALVVSALISTGATVTLWVAGVAVGALSFDFGPPGWGAVLGTVLISTVLAFATSMAGMARVGPTVTSILLTAEVPLAVTWATVLLGERLQPLQVVGGTLVVAAVLLLQAGTIRWPASLTARYIALVRPTRQAVNPAPPPSRTGDDVGALMSSQHDIEADVRAAQQAEG
jgi:drug/metabolite transporter (DMT)-like permease